MIRLDVYHKSYVPDVGFIKSALRHTDMMDKYVDKNKIPGHIMMCKFDMKIE